MKRSRITALFNVFVSLTLVVSLAPSFAWAETPAGGGSTLTTTPSGQDSSEPDPQDSGQQSAAPAKGPRKAPAAADPVAEVGGEQYDTLQEAIDVAASGETVTVLRDFEESVDTQSKRKTIIIDLDNHVWTAAERLLNSQTIKIAYYTSGSTTITTIKNGTITGGDVSAIIYNQPNGVITGYNSSITLDNVTLTGNKGCAAWVHMGKLTVSNGSKIINNDGQSTLFPSQETFGIIGASRNATITVSDSEFSNNTNADAPIGSWVTGSYYPGAYNISNTKFTNNVGTVAGALYYQGQTTSYLRNNVTIQNNKGGKAGGVLLEARYATTSLSVLNGTTISNNTAIGTGVTAGGMFISKGAISFGSSSIYNNDDNDIVVASMGSALAAANTMKENGTALSDYYYEDLNTTGSNYKTYAVGDSVAAYTASSEADYLVLKVTNGVVDDSDPNGPWNYGDKNYSTLEKAIIAYKNDSGASSAIKLLRDLQEDATIGSVATAEKPLQIDLNGKTLSATSNSSTAISITDTAYVSLSNGTISNSKYGVDVKGVNTSFAVSDVTFKDNVSNAINAQDSASHGRFLDVNSCTFENNGGTEGFAIDAVYNVSIKNSTFTGNAKGIKFAGSVPPTYEGLTFTKNTGVCLQTRINDASQEFVVKNSTFEKNTMPDNGLFTFEGDLTKITFDSCNIKNNTGTNRTVYISGSSKTATFKNCEISGNTIAGTTEAVAGIKGYLSTINLVDTVVKNNTASTTSWSSYYLDQGRVSTGGVNAFGGQLNISGSSAVYNNTASSSATENVANDIFLGEVTVDVLAAENMEDGSFDFTNYVWDDLLGDEVDTNIAGTVSYSEPKLLTAKPGTPYAVARIGETDYPSLKDAVDAAQDGDTIVIVIQEAKPKATSIRAPEIEVTKQVTLDLNGIHIQNTDDTLFNITGSGNLTIKDSVADSDAAIAAYDTSTATMNKVGGVSGVIKTADQASLTIASLVDTGKLKVNHNGAALNLHAAVNPLEVNLGVGKFITLDEDEWSRFTNARPELSNRIKVNLDPSVLAALNSGQETDDVLIAKGAGITVKNYIQVNNVTAPNVRKLHVSYDEEGDELILRSSSLNGIYIDGVNGRDDTGTGSIDSPVKTFAKAAELLRATADADGIIVKNTVTISGNEEWDLSDCVGKNTLYRWEEFTGNLVQVANGGSLLLKDIEIDGQGDNGIISGAGAQPGDGSLINVKKGGTLTVDSGAILQNNYVQDSNGYTSCGGAVYSEGTTTVKDGIVRLNRAIQGGGIYQSGGALDMTGGSVENNKAVYPTGSRSSIMPAGGGIMLAHGANMTFTAGSIKNNTSDNIGGGIALGTTGDASATCLAADATTTLTMDGANALIENNTATSEGGGIYVQINTVAYVKAGTLSNNEARGYHQSDSTGHGSIGRGGNVSHGGGGIYVNGCAESYYNSEVKLGGYKDYTPGILYLSPAEIARNESGTFSPNDKQYGGSALAFCASGDAQVFEINSSVIYDNISKSGADVYMTTIDHWHGQILEFADGAPNPMFNNIKYYVSEYALGGEPYNWQKVAIDGTIQNNGDGSLSPIDDINQLHWNDHRLALHTDLSAADVADSLAKVTVHIVDNKAGRYGGGIGSNGLVINGVESPLVDIKAMKAWDDNNQSPVVRPTSLKFNLERKKAGEEDTAFKVIKTQTVTESNGSFTVVFEEQPQYAEYSGEGAASNVAWVYRIVEDGTYKPLVEASALWKGEDASGAKTIQDIYTIAAKAGADTTRTAPEGYSFGDTITVKNFEITNTLKAGDLEVSKKVVGEGADSDKQFGFTVKLDTSVIGGVQINGTFGDLAFMNNAATVQLKADEVKTAKGLPAGVTYTVQETDYAADGYTSTSTGATGVIEQDKTATAAFTNIYNPPTPSKPVDVVLVKHLHDALIHAEEFSFGLYDENGKLLDTVHTTLGTHINPAEDEYSSYVEIAFKDLIFDKAGDYRYTIREHMDGTTQVVEGDENNLKGFEPGFYKGGVKFDDKEYRVHIAVSDEDGDGVLEATVSYPDSATGVENAELFNEYSEEYVEIDGNDEHPNDGVHEEESEKPTPKPDNKKTTPPAAKATPKTGSAKTGDSAPIAPLTLVALLAAGGAGLAYSRRRKA